MSTTTQTTTADDLLRMTDDGFRYELVRGELRKMSPAGNKHGRFSANVTISLGPHVKANKLGAVIVVLTENETLDGGDVVPSWSVKVRDIFA